MDAPSTAVGADDEDYEICNDHGFVYKRRHGLYPDAAAPSAQPAGPDLEAARRRRCSALLRLRRRRLRELERWEALERKLLTPLPAPGPPPPQAPSSSFDPSAAAATSASPSVLDDLLAQAEVAEAILKKVAGLCDEVDALCRAQEDDIADAITALPVWGDPKELVMSLQSPDAPGDLNFIKGYQHEENGGFEGSHRKATEARGYDRCQEAAGVCPSTIQSAKESGTTMKRGPIQCKTPVGLGDGPSILVGNRKKKRVASPSGSRSANKQKRVYQSTSPNPVLLSSGRITRSSAAAKMLNQEVPS